MSILFVPLTLVLLWKPLFSSAEVILISDNSLTFRNNTNLVNIYVPVRLVNSSSGTVTVTCTLNSTGSAAASVGTFNKITLSASNPNGTVIFSCSKYGREAIFFCYLNDLYATSGNAGLIQCTKPPVVNLLPRSITILRRQTPFSPNVLVKLSEQALDTVKVECHASKTTNMTLTGFTATIDAGYSQTLASIKITSAGEKSKAILTCNGQSVGGLQFKKSSTGISSNLIIESGRLTIVPQYSNVYATQAQLLLFVNGLISDLNLNCGLTVLQTAQDADKAMNSSECTQSDEPDAFWNIEPSSITFQASTTSSRVVRLKLYRVSYPSVVEAGKVEILVVRCCNPVMNQSLDPVFGGVQVAARINVLLKTPFFFETGDEYPTQTESSLPNPAFVNIAPCPCDLIALTCDPGCCCDPMCQSSQSVSCLPGPFGGGPIPVDPFNCLAHADLFSYDGLVLQPYSRSNGTQLMPVRLAEMHTLFCVTAENNAALGYYYPSLGVIRNLSAWNTHLDSRGSRIPLVSPKDDGNRGIYSYNGNYRYDDPLRLITDEVTLVGVKSVTTNESPKRPVLMVPNPQNCLSSEGVAIRFLHDFPTYRCPIAVTRDSCSAAGEISKVLAPGLGPTTQNSRLLGKTYLISDDVASRLSPPIYELLASLRDGGNRSQTKVNYYCLSAAEVDYFTESTETRSTEPEQVGFFDQICQFDSITNVTTCESSSVASVGTGTTVTEDCPWDDGFTLVPDAILLNDTCDNIVLRVDYRFYWAEGLIPRAEADIYLASVNTTLERTYYQSFSVKFIHRSLQLSTAPPSIFKSSGVYGYDVGAQLITGTINTSPTSGTFSVTVDSPSLRVPGIATIQPEVGGLCQKSSYRSVRFAENSMGTCGVNLNLTHFDDCTRLRSLVKSQVDRFISSDVIGVYGNPSTFSSGDWVRIQREQVQLYIPRMTSPQLQNLSLWSNEEFNKGVCELVPSGVTLNIFYAEQGKVDGDPILQIIGAHARYDYEDWRLTCDSGANPFICPTSSSNEYRPKVSVSQKFFIHTKVTFTLVPQDWATRISVSANFSQRRSERIASTQACPYDACWREAFYAWTVFPRLFGADFGRQNAYQIAVSLGLGGLVFGMLMITRPFI